MPALNHLHLHVGSVERAREMGINWWEGDPSLSRIGSGDDDNGDRGRLEQENRELRERLDRLERLIGAGESESSGG